MYIFVNAGTKGIYQKTSAVFAVRGNKKSVEFTPVITVRFIIGKVWCTLGEFIACVCAMH